MPALRLTSLFLALAFGLVPPAPARAEVALDGRFVADRACPATPSIRKKANPGNVRTRAGQAYAALAANRADPTHYLVLMPGAAPERRWVRAGCGRLVQGEAGRRGDGTTAAARERAQAPRRTRHVLAVNWQPGFCETRPSVRECRTQTAARFDASHFSLHGLWPQPPGTAYCGVPAALVERDKAGAWKTLPELGLQTKTLRELVTVMPGAASYLHRHEWIKHGACYGGDAETYYRRSLALMRALNGSEARAFFAARIGETVTAGEIRRAFDAAFGKGAGKRVRVVCVDDPSSGRRLIGEITIALSGALEPEARLGELIHAARPTGSSGCQKGIIDAAGLQ
ncbi:ribonuclease T2 family protein [Nitratireductor alexandrii]|uniref:ribonuclease T2 family protein n=1 Tax=Nitratireductor alexandrii TaxID=2448161 RepID=UPI000FDAA2E6|nr:ribonuclease [Nitratireductor alexandrii]